MRLPACVVRILSTSPPFGRTDRPGNCQVLAILSTKSATGGGQTLHAALFWGSWPQNSAPLTAKRSCQSVHCCQPCRAVHESGRPPILHTYRAPSARWARVGVHHCLTPTGGSH